MPNGEEVGTGLICGMPLVALKSTSGGSVGGGWLGLFFTIFPH